MCGRLDETKPVVRFKVSFSSNPVLDEHHLANLFSLLCW